MDLSFVVDQGAMARVGSELDGQDIGAIAVANGHALDCRRYSGGRYRDLETPAARSRIQRAGYCR
jgi:micrococcal nuclease